MALRRGFKSEAGALAREVRSELGLSPYDRLEPHGLAQHLDIPVLPLSEFSSTVAGARHFLAVDRQAFSALTVFDGRRRLIVHNDAHPEPRQNSNLTHELAHGLLFHEPSPAVDTATGCRHWNDTNEQEANWLAGELLVTVEMALAVARGHLTQQLALERFAVSERMLRWRLNATGAVKRAERERARRGTKRSPASRRGFAV